jgi:hypothetical protein
VCPPAANRGARASGEVSHSHPVGLRCCWRAIAIWQVLVPAPCYLRASWLRGGSKCSYVLMQITCTFANMGPEFAIFLGTYSRVHAETLRRDGAGVVAPGADTGAEGAPAPPRRHRRRDDPERHGDVRALHRSSAKRKSPSYDIGTSTTTEDGTSSTPSPSRRAR